MKKTFYCLLLVLLTAAACKKNVCNTVIVTQTGTACSFWGVKILNITYPSNNIPDIYKQEGLAVCAEYELYEDLTLCACCGGTRARILSMNPLPD